MSERWDNHFLGMALYHSKLSKDPATRVGSVIIGPDREILSAGFNGFPRGIADTHERLHNRDTKLKLVVHAEMNALLAAARTGMRLKGCTLYLAATDDTGLVWGGPPCTRCTVEIIQVGISEIVSHPVKAAASKWHEDLILAKSLIEESGIIYREVPYFAHAQRALNSCQPIVEEQRGGATIRHSGSEMACESQKWTPCWCPYCGEPHSPAIRETKDG